MPDIEQRWVPWMVGSLVVALVYSVVAPLVPEPGGWMNGDYGYFLPRILSNLQSHRVQGPFSIIWFTPSFCGGLPALANPQDTQFHLVQWLVALLGPIPGVRMTVVVLTGVGFWGMFRFVRGPLGQPIWAAVLGAALFACNGAFVHRAIAGQLAYLTIMLTPLLASLVVGRRSLAQVLWAGVLLAWIVLSGNATMAVPIGLSIIALAALAVLTSGVRIRRFVWQFALAAVVAMALSLFKLMAVASFMAHFPRNLYVMPGTSSIWSSINVFLQALLGWQGAGVVNPNWWPLGVVEFEFGITPVGLGLAAWGLVVLARKARNPAGWAVLGLLLLAPVVLNWHHPMILAAVDAIPVVNSASSLFRYYWVVVPVLTALAGTVLLSRKGVMVCLIAVAAWVMLEDKSDYRERIYHDGAVTRAWLDGMPPIGGIATEVVTGVRRDDAFMAGMSAVPCYEPLFGYGLEQFPTRALRAGPVFGDDAINLMDPRCLVAPEEFGCRPGDRFDMDQRHEAEAFMAYQDLPFQTGAQRIANIISAVAWLLMPLVLLGGYRRRR